MGRIITIASGKGGVGKTTLVTNLAAALAGFKFSTVAVDGNLSTPNLGVHLGIPLYPVTLQNVINGEVRLRDALYKHKSGFRIVPSDISFANFSKTSREDLMEVFYELADDFDFVLIDSAAGLGREAMTTVRAADELITITNPDHPSLVDALKLGRMAKDGQTENLGVVVNRVGYDKTDVKLKEIEEFLNLPILGKIPEDRTVRRALNAKEPVVTYKPHAKSSLKIKEIAAKLAGIEYKPNQLAKLFSWLK